MSSDHVDDDRMVFQALDLASDESARTELADVLRVAAESGADAESVIVRVSERCGDSEPVRLVAAWMVSRLSLESRRDEVEYEFMAAVSRRIADQMTAADAEVAGDLLPGTLDRIITDVASELGLSPELGREVYRRRSEERRADEA